ncbi:MAG: MFS transporter, partial [Candidatus Hydrogenedentes bacterium]|nr:MFS transporter [Candidatus Hydrogenedentota bacterium]
MTGPSFSMVTGMVSLLRLHGNYYNTAVRAANREKSAGDEDGSANRPYLVSPARSLRTGVDGDALKVGRFRRKRRGCYTARHNARHTMTHFHPKESLSQDDIALGMRMMLYDAAFVTVMAVLTTGAFLVGFALALGASNVVVGVIAAAGPLAQILQLPSILLIERYRKRKLLTLYAAAVSRVTWLFIAAVPWTVPRDYWIPSFVVLLLVHFATGNLAGCAWNSWVRDLVPTPVFGTFFAKRLALATFIGAVLSVAGAVAVDMGNHRYGSAMGAYAGIFVVAAVSSAVSLVFVARMPEPAMPMQHGASIRDILRQPLQDMKFRAVLIFLAWWNFAVNFAAPFFAVYMLRKLDLSMVWVIGLSVLSQLVNVVFFRVWGRLADRYSNKSVLTVSGPLFIVSFLIWPFTTMPDAYFLTVPLLIAIHVLAGIST